MSTQLETEKKQPKRKRSSKIQQAGDGHVRKRVKSDHVSPLEEQTAKRVVNGSKEDQHDEATIRTNGILEPNGAAINGQSQLHGPDPSSGRKRKRDSDTKSKKTNGLDTQSRDQHEKTESFGRGKRSLLEQTAEQEEDNKSNATVKTKERKVNNDTNKPTEPLEIPYIHAPQISALDRPTSPREGAVIDANGVSGTKSKKKKLKGDTTDDAVLGGNKRRKQRWNITEPLAGHFIHHDPIFSPDERYIILGHRRAVYIYSIATSILVRTLPVSKSEVCALALSAVDTDKIYVATTDGVVLLWNWITGQRLGRWELQCQITGLWTTVETSATEDTVFIVEESKSHKHHTITAHRLRYGSDASKTTSITLFEPQRYVQGLKVLSHGEVVVSVFQQSLAVGQLNCKKNHTFEEKSYVWREIDCVNDITCFDACITPKRKSKAKDYNTSTNVFVDVVVGTMKGPIFIYSDLINKLINQNRQKDSISAPSYLDPKRLHWHREAVGTVKWSKDGNYLISGGKETVLVLWQLETAKSQFLPNLLSDIESLVVSPSGAAYAVRLSDNSLMVLSTSELKPKAHVAGIQIQNFLPGASRLPTPKTFTMLLNPSRDPLDSLSRTPAVFSPLSTHQLLLIVPASQSRDKVNSLQVPASYLQTFDVSTSHHVSRQPLTRNNATNFNLGPEGIKLEDPNVKLMRLSRDGKWLATVDEWIPPTADTDFLAADPLIAREEQLRRREVYLKFWVWNEKDGTWMLETRVDVPHQSSDGTSPGSIDDLASDPRRMSFSTVGQDGVVRVWRPRTTFPNNRVVRGVHQGGIVSWSCHLSSRLQIAQSPYNTQDGAPDLFSLRSACLAYSCDGSALAACQSAQDDASGSTLYLIDTESGAIAYIRTLPTVGSVLGIGFLERHIVVLSENLIVWDPVKDALVYGYDLHLSRLTRSQRQHLCHIAVSPSDGTFALAISNVKSRPKQRSKGNLLEQDTSCHLLIFEPTSPNPIFASSIPQLATGLIPGPQSKGYVVIDSSAQIRILTSNTTFPVSIARPIAGPNESLAELNDMEEEQGAHTLRRLRGENETEPSTDLVHGPSHRPSMDNEVDDGDYDNSVIRSEKLAEILDVRPSYGSPSVQDMFNAVVRLAQKPRTSQGEHLPET